MVYFKNVGNTINEVNRKNKHFTYTTSVGET